MKNPFVWAALLALFAGVAAARGSVPIIDYENVAIATASGKVPGAEEARQAIAAAVSAAPGGWSVARTADNILVATLTVRGKHAISVSITPGPGVFSVRYADSTNMKYSEEGGVRYIHPNYNKWVSGLLQSIRSEFARR